MNNLDPEVAERPDDLVVYGGTGKAARDWRSFDAMVRTLTTLGDDETMLVQSGRPVGVLRTHEWAPRVLIANSNLVGDWATWPEFRRLEQLGLTMYGQMTAGSWIYIGTQGILQGTYETFAAVAAKRFGGTLAGTLTLTGGCGGMGGAQPLAVTMNGGVCLVVDVDPAAAAAPGRAPLPRRGGRRPRRRHRAGLRGREARAPGLSVGVVGNCAEVLPELLRRGVADRHRHRPDLRPRPAVLPARRASRSTDWADYAAAKPEEFTDRARESMARHVEAMVGFLDAGAEVFDYGNSIRGEARLGGYERAFDFPGFVPAYIRPLFCEGKGPFRWAALSGDPADIAATDQAVLDLFPDNDPLHRWIRGRAGAGRVPGPAGPDLLARLRRAGPGRAAVQRDGRRPASCRAPIVIGRDHLDAARSPRRTARPRRWPTAPTRSPTGRCSTRWSTPRPARPGCRSTTAAASASAARSTPGRSRVADGTALAAQKLERVLTNDPAMGVHPARRRRLRRGRRGRRRSAASAIPMRERRD